MPPTFSWKSIEKVSNESLTAIPSVLLSLINLNCNQHKEIYKMSWRIRYLSTIPDKYRYIKVCHSIFHLTKWLRSFSLCVHGSKVKSMWFHTHLTQHICLFIAWHFNSYMTLWKKIIKQIFSWSLDQKKKMEKLISSSMPFVSVCFLNSFNINISILLCITIYNIHLEPYLNGGVVWFLGGGGLLEGGNGGGGSAHHQGGVGGRQVRTVTRTGGGQADATWNKQQHGGNESKHSQWKSCYYT